MAETNQQTGGVRSNENPQTVKANPPVSTPASQVAPKTSSVPGAVTQGGSSEQHAEAAKPKS